MNIARSSLPRAFLHKLLATRSRVFVAGMFLVTLIIISRKPILLIVPRFWWDESAIHYGYALDHSLMDTLMAVHQGYFSLINNIFSALATRLATVEQAPFVSTYMAFLVILLPHMLVWGGRCRYWDSPASKLTASLIILFTSADCSIWLNVVSAQFHLSLLTFLLLVEDWKGRSRACIALYGALLVLAGLSGVVSCFLLPLYAWKYWNERSREGAVLLGLFATAGAFALVGVVSFYFINPTAMYAGVERFHPRPRMVGSYIHLVLVNIFMPMRSRDLPMILHSWLVVALGYALLAAGGRFFSRSLDVRGRRFFLGAFVLLSVVSMATALDSRGHVRYFYAANVILMLMVQQSTVCGSLYRRLLAMALIAWVVAVGARDFYFHYDCYNRDWPVWEQEVARWRNDPAYRPRTHPRGGNIDWRAPMERSRYSPE